MLLRAPLVRVWEPDIGRLIGARHAGEEVESMNEPGFEREAFRVVSG